MTSPTARPSPRHPGTVPSGIAGSDIRILAVDDEPKNLLALEAVLGDLGTQIVRAASGREALLRLLEESFALILLDVQMPEMDGYETAALIRERERTRHVPIIFLTAYQRSDRQVRRGYEVGAVDFLFKPIVPDVLRSKVAVFLDLHRKTEEVRRQAELLRLAEQREHERQLADAQQRFEAARLQEEREAERRLAESLQQRADELARNVAERERAEAALRRSNAHLEILAEAASRFLLETRPRDVLPALHRVVAERMGYEVCGCYVLDESGETLELRAHVGFDEATASAQAIVPLASAHFVAHAARERRTLVLADVQRAEPELAPAARALGFAAYACLPLVAHARLLGVLTYATRHRASFDDDDVAVLQLVADQAAMALDRARLLSELQERARELADADRRKDEFLAMLAHELRNPLAPILNALELVRMRGAPDDVVLRRARDAMDRQVRHLARLVDDLLDVSRITSGKIELRRERVDLAAVVDHALQISRPLLESKRHRCVVELCADEVTLDADPTRLAQVLANLLNNAAKYTDEGGRIELSTSVEGGEALVRIRDSGIGLTAEMLPRVFELFVQVDRTADRSLGGLGIGLTLVRRLVEMHGGTVVASSDGPGRGSEFVVRLPVASVSTAAAASSVDAPVLLAAAGGDLVSPPGVDEAPPEPARGDRREGPATGARPLRILVVEDNADIRETLRDVLELLGYVVETAEDGASGIERALALRPDVALIDIGLPKVDGYVVARRLREALNGHADRTRLIAMTGYGQPDDRRRALDAGFDAHLVKPVEPETLTRLIGSTSQAGFFPNSTGDT